MAVVVDATVNGPNANSFLLLTEAQAYWDTRLFVDIWEDSEDKSMALILATRTLVNALSPRREFVPPSGSQKGYYINHSTWTGAPATVGQSLPWGRVGMYDRNGNAIPATVIPQDLKNATAELAGQMSKSDRMLDNDIAVQGITAVRAGSVSVNYKDDVLALSVLPRIIRDMLVPSWLTDQTIESMFAPQFDIMSGPFQ